MKKTKNKKPIVIQHNKSLTYKTFFFYDSVWKDLAVGMNTGPWQVRNLTEGKREWKVKSKRFNLLKKTNAGFET